MTLAIVFLVLKLVGVISWSWLWVLSPIWIEVLLFIGYVILYTILNVIVECFK